MLDLVILGIVQGLTEFLPVSSTAHLLFAEHYLGIRRPGIVLEAPLHLGTTTAAVVLFWPDVVRLVRGCLALLRRPALARHPVAQPPLAPEGSGDGPLQRMFESVRGAAYQLLVAGTMLLWHRERGARSGHRDDPDRRDHRTRAGRLDRSGHLALRRHDRNGTRPGPAPPRSTRRDTLVIRA